MTQPTPQVLQTYTLLQIAAETFLGETEPGDPAATAGTGVASVDLDTEMLKDGNRHSSRMTHQQAIDFAADWEVVSHQPNTATGFSATLFKLKPGRADANKGTYEGQSVVSFRSTEFIEDHARDNKATNELEIQVTGWALGQLADMRSWWASVEPLLGGARVDVTGYSLGGHLATAFNQLYPSQVRSYYTFNGAGVGAVKPGHGLHGVLNEFDARRAEGSNADLFSDGRVRALYDSLRARFAQAGGANRVNVQRSNEELAALRLSLYGQQGSALAVRQLEYLEVAIWRIGEIVKSVTYLGGISAQGGGRPAQIDGGENIAGLRLDYQIAVLRASPALQALGTGAASSALGEVKSLFIDPRTGAGDGVGFDVYGAPWPSAVANSQRHTGRATAVFIEDQPLTRGSAVAQIVGYKLLGETRAILDGYDKNDFGDTHSIVLLADSLRVQAALADLTPLSGANAATLATFAALFPLAGKAKADGGGQNDGQGAAEGDTVEQLLDSARRVLLGPDVQPTLKDQADKALKGGTWADWNGHSALRVLLEQSVTGFTSATSGLKGKLRIEFPGAV